MTNEEMIALAKSHLDEKRPMNSSAVACIADAERYKKHARYWALKSLEYSVGRLHPDYKRARDEKK